MNEATATKLCELTDAAIVALNTLVVYSNTRIENESDRDGIRLAVATCLATLDLDVRELAYKNFPHLKPDFLR
jgi:hypothetical protein